MKLPESVNNRLSMTGAVVAFISLMFIVFFFVLSLFYQQGSSYLGLFTYIILPAFLLMGLILIPIGMIGRMRRMKRGIEPVQGKPWIIDFTDRRHRNATIVFGFGTIILLFLTGIGSYEAFHYTESVKFCGTTCHKVMEPEHTAYQNSEHANVRCVECHVGEGAGWYVKSKMSGLRQVWAVITNSYSHPIETPIANLRPARETCERCHWPEKFYSHKLVAEKHYLADSANTEWNIDLRMKIAALHSALGNTEGIHWHINPNVLIEYIDPADDREALPWVKSTNKLTGEVTIYQDSEAPASDSVIKFVAPRTMDCMDCHTRPSHKYLSPSVFIDHGIAAGEIPVNLPNIKRVAMDILVPAWDNRQIAHDTITKYVEAFYRDTYPEILASRKTDIDQAIAGMISGYSKNIFPEMKATWEAYPDHIGHMEANGCFRCHNGKHISESGKRISNDCNLCHSIMLQGTPGSEEVAPFNGALDFNHPQGDDSWKEMACADCHKALY
jgi:nitrate/TMAO reductase-like tetraheme cytochrome c subunit